MKRWLLLLTLVTSIAFSQNTQQPRVTFAQAIVGQWQTITGNYIVTADYHADNTYTLHVSSVMEEITELRGTYKIEGNTLTQTYPDGSEQVSTLESLVMGSFMKFVGAESFWISSTQMHQVDVSSNMLMTTQTNTTSDDLLRLSMQYEMDMQQIQMMNDAINQSAQMGQGIAYDIGGTAWDWDYGY